jgi:hypothetical protein
MSNHDSYCDWRGVVTGTSAPQDGVGVHVHPRTQIQCMFGLAEVCVRIGSACCQWSDR